MATNRRNNGKWSDMQLKLAVKSVMVDGKSKKQAAKLCGIPRQTLQDYLRRIKNEGECGVQKLRNGRPTTLNEAQEFELVKLLKSMSNRLYGMSPKVVRELVFNYCEINHIDHRFNKDEKKAGEDWLRGFLQRHPSLSVRVAEATSMQRAVGFNKAKVKRFFDELKRLMFDDNGKQVIPSGNICLQQRCALTAWVTSALCRSYPHVGVTSAHAAEKSTYCTLFRMKG